MNAPISERAAVNRAVPRLSVMFSLEIAGIITARWVRDPERLGRTAGAP